MIRIALLLALTLVAACDPRRVIPSDLKPNEVTALRGTWEGEGTLTFGESYCPTNYLWTLRVADGNVEADIVDKATPNAPRARFTTYVDYEGGVFATVRPTGRDTNVRGYLSRNMFSGEAKSRECTYLVRLRRTGT